MPLVIDSHAHIFPDPWGWAHRSRSLRQRARQALAPAFEAAHRAQTWMRLLPKPVREKADSVGMLAVLPSLAVASARQDLEEQFERALLDAAVVIAHPPQIPNEFILESAQENPRLIPVVNLGTDAHQPEALLTRYAKEGARALKIHTVADGLEPSSELYSQLLERAASLGLPVILHTGCMPMPFSGHDPGLAQVERFAPWFARYKETRFILAHMNFHEPSVALDLAEDHPNVLVETSWQPTEIIGEAVRRLGPERVLFGSDWPFVGENITIGLERVRECVSGGLLSEEGAALVLGENASRIFGFRATAGSEGGARE